MQVAEAGDTQAGTCGQLQRGVQTCTSAAHDDIKLVGSNLVAGCGHAAPLASLRPSALT